MKLRRHSGVAHSTRQNISVRYVKVDAHVHIRIDGGVLFCSIQEEEDDDELRNRKTSCSLRIGVTGSTNCCKKFDRSVVEGASSSLSTYAFSLSFSTSLSD